MSRAAAKSRKQLSNGKRDEYREMAHAIIKDLAYRTDATGRQIEVLGDLLDELAYRDL